MPSFSDSDSAIETTTATIAATVTATDARTSSGTTAIALTAADARTGTDTEGVFFVIASSDSGVIADSADTSNSGLTISEVDSAVSVEAEQVTLATFTGSGSVFGAGTPRWTFIDPRGVLTEYNFPINPNQMSDPTRKKNTTILGSKPVNNLTRGTRASRLQPKEWTFSGTLLTQAQYDSFQQWFELDQRIWLKDHFGRVWIVRLLEYAPELETATALHPWRAKYSIRASVYRRMS
jgi:hypothetical protein